MIDPSVAGRAYPSFTVRLEAGGIRNFADAVGDDRDLFSDPDVASKTRFEGLVAPPTYATCFREGEFAVLQDLEVDMRNLLHGDQTYHFERPVRPGDVLTCTPKILKVAGKDTSRGRMDFLTIETRVADPDGQVVCLATSTMAIRSE